jgi:hypothetical protein
MFGGTVASGNTAAFQRAIIGAGNIEVMAVLTAAGI